METDEYIDLLEQLHAAEIHGNDDEINRLKRLIGEDDDVTSSVELPAKLRVTIREPLWLGFCIGLGLGAALIVYGLLALAIASIFINLGIR